MQVHAQSEGRDAACAAEQLVRGATTAERRGAERLRARIADLTTDAAARLDDRIRALLDHQLGGMIDRIELALRERAARLLLTRGDRALAARIRGGGDVAWPRLSEKRAIDGAIVAELLARLRHDLIAAGLPPGTGEDNVASLLIRLTEIGDARVSAAARALLVADSRRREALDFSPVTGSELPAELHQQLVWRVAAAIREDGAEGLDRALAEAAHRIVAEHDEGERAEAVAMRLALAIDARPEELAALIDEALGDGRLSLIVAVLAQAGQLSFEQVRNMLVEPDDERWWLLLRAVGLDPLTVARIALALTGADSRRYADELPDLLDAVNAVPVDNARAVLAPLRLPADFRAAIEAIAREGRP